MIIKKMPSCSENRYELAGWLVSTFEFQPKSHRILRLYRDGLDSAMRLKWSSQHARGKPDREQPKLHNNFPKGRESTP